MGGTATRATTKACSQYVALLRAVNLGPHNKIAMRDLTALAAGLGLASPRTLLQSGNLVFGASGISPADLETRFERKAVNDLGLDTAFFVRTAAAWAAIVSANPFPDVAAREPARLVVMCLKTAPTPAAVAGLRKAIGTSIPGREVLEVRGREAFIVYPDGIGVSKLTTRALERALGTAGTARNWNTVTKLHALLQA